MAVNANAIIENQIAKAAQVVEDCLDAEIKRLDNLDSDEVERLRQQRLNQMKKFAQKKQDWIAKGHGTYYEIPTEKDFFDETKKSERVVCHFYRESTFRCKILDQHLATVAKKHVETKFIKIDAEKSMFLCQKLKIKVLPTLALIKDSKTQGFVVGFDDLGGVDEFPTEMLEWRLGVAEMINYSGDKPTLKSNTRGGNIIGGHINKKNGKNKNRYDDDDDDDDYDDDE